MNTGIAFWKQKGRPASNGGVAQLGEHLPCKQGVKSSNLSISIRNLMIKFRDTYLENRILNRNELIIQLNIKTSEIKCKITQFNWLKWIQFQQKQITVYNAIYQLLSVRKNLIFATRSSEEERRVDALALRADERRDKLR